MMFLNLTPSSRGGGPPPNGGATLYFYLRCKNPRSAAVRLDRRSAKSEYRRQTGVVWCGVVDGYGQG
jgi:hypothetical protein